MVVSHCAIMQRIALWRFGVKAHCCQEMSSYCLYINSKRPYISWLSRSKSKEQKSRGKRTVSYCLRALTPRMEESLNHMEENKKIAEALQSPSPKDVVGGYQMLFIMKNSELCVCAGSRREANQLTYNCKYFLNYTELYYVAGTEE